VRAPVDISLLGNLLICGILVSAAYAMATALNARGERRHLLDAARYGAYATCALTAAATFLLAYAFQAHAFHIRYVAQYSDRSMSWPYLLAALWGGQDGSLLSWTFALTGYIAVCVHSLRGKHLALQPYILATLMSIVIFFAVLMLFAANPFSASPSGSPPDGQGLNPLLRSYWMLVHPPILYLGMVGWSVPFAFVTAALISGRLDDGWIGAVRRWVLFAWLTLGMGNVLGMIWSYEELGWGGYWAWDPVENASFLPMLAGTAYLHSAVRQEQRGMFRIWNPFLLCLAFFLTIFGTFLTRSGMIASVHAFARSSMGTYFVVYMALIAATSFALIGWRLPKLKTGNGITRLLSRDFLFLLFDWLMMAMLIFIVAATLSPLVSEYLRDETVTIGAGFYNRWMLPLGLFLLFILGFGPCLGWRGSSPERLRRTLIVPSLAALGVALAHALLGPAAGYPPLVSIEADGGVSPGAAAALVMGVSPVVASTLCTFAVAAHLQEIWRGTANRMRGARRGNPLRALAELIAGSRRRYGGYIVHLGLIAMCFGFTGAAYDAERQASLRPGQSAPVDRYRVRFDGARVEDDLSKRMLLADMSVLRNGKTVGTVTPGRYFYAKPPGSNTTEVSIHTTAREDIYVILNRVNSASMVGTFRIIVRPFVVWIWIGGMVMFLGAVVCLWPASRKREKV
jgi:cytochrome c-type biogenesis protein CcmF